jgi:hypothetical protein
MSAPTDATRVDPLDIPKIHALAAIVPTWPTASAALGGSPAGLGRRATYEAAKNGTYPVPVLSQGGRQMVCRRADILAYLGLTDDGTGVPAPVPSIESSPIPTTAKQ